MITEERLNACCCFTLPSFIETLPRRGYRFLGVAHSPSKSVSGLIGTLRWLVAPTTGVLLSAAAGAALGFFGMRSRKSGQALISKVSNAAEDRGAE